MIRLSPIALFGRVVFLGPRPMDPPISMWIRSDHIRPDVFLGAVLVCGRDRIRVFRACPTFYSGLRVVVFEACYFFAPLPREVCFCIWRPLVSRDWGGRVYRRLAISAGFSLGPFPPHPHPLRSGPRRT